MGARYHSGQINKFNIKAEIFFTGVNVEGRREREQRWCAELLACAQLIQSLHGVSERLSKEIVNFISRSITKIIWRICVALVELRLNHLWRLLGCLFFICHFFFVFVVLELRLDHINSEQAVDDDEAPKSNVGVCIIFSIVSRIYFFGDELGIVSEWKKFHKFGYSMLNFKLSIH